MPPPAPPMAPLPAKVALAPAAKDRVRPSVIVPLGAVRVAVADGATRVVARLPPAIVARALIESSSVAVRSPGPVMVPPVWRMASTVYGWLTVSVPAETMIAGSR